MDGPSKYVNPACMRSRRAQARKGLGKTSSWVQALPQAESGNPGTHCRAWPFGKANAEVQMLVKANSKPHDIIIYFEGSVTRDRSDWGFTVKHGGRTVHEDSGAQSEDLQSGHGGRSTLTGNEVASPQAWHTDYTCDHTRGLNEPAAKGRVWHGLPGLAHSNCTVLAAQTSVDQLPRAKQSQWKWKGRQTGKHISHLVCSLAGQRCPEARGTFWTWTGQSITALIT